MAACATGFGWRATLRIFLPCFRQPRRRTIRARRAGLGVRRKHWSQSVESVSVVIPTYNRAELLKVTIQSILGQTVRPLEIIIVDDGSTDDTANVCASFGPVVRYMGQRNGGVSAARNAGIRAAQGDWIAFCDSDDLWVYNKLELQLAAIEATSAGWSVTGFALIDPEGRSIADGEDGFRLSFPVFSESRVTPEQHFAQWLEE